MKSNFYPLLFAMFIVCVSFVKPVVENPTACKVYVPNAFSPNEDGVNDTFQPFVGCAVIEYDFKVFNRWGQLMFSSQNPDDSWDGDFKGRPADANVYLYTLTVTYDNEGTQEEEVKTGDVALIR